MVDTEEALVRPPLPFAAGELAEIRPCQIGTVLQTARLAARLSIEAVVGQTRIRGSYIEAIETGKLDSFAAPIYAIGFARNYASAVGLDPVWAANEMRLYVDAASPSWRRSGR